MKKIIGKLAGTILAAATLFSVASCKNQLDYVNDTTALNKFNVLGLSVTGLDASYNHADIALMVREKNDEKDNPVFVPYVSGKVSDSYQNDKGETIGYKEGTAYIKLDAEKLFDGDSLHTSTFECYLKVGDNTLKLLDGTNAKLAVPTSPADTKDKDLKKKWVDVVVNGDYGTFSFKNESKEDDFVNVTLYNIKLDLLGKTKDQIAAMDGVDITTSAKKGTNQKYTLTIKGLKENAGMKVVLGGADISIKDSDLGNNWYDKDNFAKEIKLTEDETDATVSWEFYGSAVNGGNIAGWARTYDKSVAGPELKLTLYSAESEASQDNQPLFLSSGVSRNGTAGDSENFMFPGYTVGDFDVECTIDISKLSKTEATISKDDPVASMNGYEIAKITVSSKALATAKNVLGDDGKLWFMEGTCTGETVWGAASTNFVTGKEITLDSEGEVGTVSFLIPEEKRHTYFSKEMQLIKTPGIQVVYLKAGTTEFGDAWSNVVKVLDGSVSSDVYGWKYKNQKVELKIADTTCTFVSCPIYISAIRLINAKDVKDGTSIKFLEAWVPGNTWSATTPVKADISNGKSTYTFKSPVAIYSDSLKIQIVCLKDGATEFGVNWQNVQKICPDSFTVANKYDLNKYVLQFDAATSSLTLETE